MPWSCRRNDLFVTGLVPPPRPLPLSIHRVIPIETYPEECILWRPSAPLPPPRVPRRTYRGPHPFNSPCEYSLYLADGGSAGPVLLGVVRPEYKGTTVPAADQLTAWGGWLVVVSESGLLQGLMWSHATGRT